MNNKEQFIDVSFESLKPPQMCCLVCLKKDEEDNYIVFNLLYRIIFGQLFHQASKNDELNYDLDIPPQTEEEKLGNDTSEDEMSSEEKLTQFKEKISVKLLKSIITCTQFDQLLREIFKTKYGILEEGCTHAELAMSFSKMFEAPKEDHLDPDSAVSSPTKAEYTTRIERLLASIKQFKNDIEKYHSEINELANHIVSRLFNNHSQLIKQNDEDLKEDANDDDDESIELNNENNGIEVEMKIPEGNGMKAKIQKLKSDSMYKQSTAASSHESNQSNGVGMSFSSEKSTDMASNSQNTNRKASRYASFKSKLPKKATDILKNWFLANIQNPYPSHEAKETLSKLTNLSKKQIQNWFTNSRKRFLEPLKKKIDSNKKEDDNTLDGQSSIDRNSASQQHTQSERSQSNPMNIESQPFHNPLQSREYPHINNSAFIPQNQPTEQMQKPFMQPQRIQPTSISAPAMVYQGYIPAGQLNTGASIVILNPYMMTQPSMGYSYRPIMANVVPVNASFVPFQQGNITIMNQSNMVGGPYIVPIQPMNLRGPMGQNLSTSFNTINNNVFHNINNMNGGTELIINDTSPKFPDIESAQINMESANHNQNIINNPKMRPKHELEGVYVTTKHLHKDDAKDQG